MRVHGDTLQRGFTLIEVLIVIAIISILASFVLSSVIKTNDEARKSIAAVFVSNLSNAAEQYYQDTGKYPGAEFRDGENAFPALFEAIFGERPPRGMGGPGAPYLELRRRDIVSPEGEGAYRKASLEEICDPGVPKYILDPWGNPYVYREYQSRSQHPFTRRKALVYSSGPDGIDQMAYGEERDDIGNW